MIKHSWYWTKMAKIPMHFYPFFYHPMYVVLMGLSTLSNNNHLLGHAMLISKWVARAACVSWSRPLGGGGRPVIIIKVCDAESIGQSCLWSAAHSEAERSLSVVCTNKWSPYAMLPNRGPTTKHWNVTLAVKVAMLKKVCLSTMSGHMAALDKR